MKAAVALKILIPFSVATKLNTNENSTVKKKVTKPNRTHIFATQYSTTTARMGKCTDTTVPIRSASRSTVFSW